MSTIDRLRKILGDSLQLGPRARAHGQRPLAGCDSRIRFDGRRDGHHDDRGRIRNHRRRRRAFGGSVRDARILGKICEREALALRNYDLSAAFTGQPGDRLLVVSHRPVDRARGAVLLVPPFAEEMNKCRRMLTLVARDLAARGFVTVLPDLFGTGDSDGEFAQSSWSRWQADLARVCSLVEEQGTRVVAVVAVRTGCVLASEVAASSGWRL